MATAPLTVEIVTVKLVKERPKDVQQFLANLEERVQEIIVKEIAKADRSLLRFEAARGAFFAIGNTCTALGYQNLLDTLVDNVVKTVRGQLDTLEGIVRDLGVAEGFALANMSGRIDRFINTLALASWQPKLTGLSHSYAIVTNETKFNVSVSGGFKCFTIKNGNGECTLNIYNERIPIIRKTEATAYSLGFEVLAPDARFFAPDAASSGHYVMGELIVKYWVPLTNATPFVGRHWISRSKVLLGFLPLEIGQITVEATNTGIVGVDEEHFRSADYTLSRKNYESGKEIKISQDIRAPEGWRIRESTAQRHLAGVASPIPIELVKPTAITLVQTLPATEEGEIREYVTCTYERDRIGTITDEKKIRLRWGQTERIAAPQVSVTYKPFDGSPEVTINGAGGCLYLEVRKIDDNNYDLVAVPPEH